MVKRLDKITEYEVAFVAMQIAANNPNGEVTFQEIIAKLPNIVNLSDEDLKPNPKRPGELMWEQRVRNLKSHDQIEKNFLNKGFLEHVKGTGYRITPLGRSFLKNNMTQHVKSVFTAQP